MQENPTGVIRSYFDISVVIIVVAVAGGFFVALFPTGRFFSENIHIYRSILNIFPVYFDINITPYNIMNTSF